MGEYSKNSLDSSTLTMLKKLYVQGQRVEAITVNYIPKGMRGVVREVRNNGDVSVIWNNGDITSVVFGVDCIRAITDGQCMLGYSMFSGKCGSVYCRECGWNDIVHQKRVREIQNGGLKKMPNGVQTYIVKGSEKNCLENGKE